VEGELLGVARAEQARLAKEEKGESQRRKTLERELEWIRMSPKGQHAKSKERIRRYEELLEEGGKERVKTAQLTIPPGPRLGDIVVEASGLTMAYGEKLLFQDLDFSRASRGGRRDRWTERCR
jgi:sulfate-transporting ATPase